MAAKACHLNHTIEAQATANLLRPDQGNIRRSISSAVLSQALSCSSSIRM